MYNKYLCLLVLLIVTFYSYSKDDNDNSKLILVGQEPIHAKFVGGIDSLNSYLRSCIKIPFVYDDTKSIENRIVIRFLIDTNGIVKEPTILKDNVGFIKQADILDVFSKMPKWIPSIMYGKTIEQYYTIPIFIKLDSGQINIIAKEVDELLIFDRAEVMPKYPGGPQAMMSYIIKNIKYDGKAEDGIPEKIVIKLIIDKEGKVINPKIVKSSGLLEFDKEVLRVIKEMPTWIPAKQRNIPVNCYYTIPIQPEFLKN